MPDLRLTRLDVRHAQLHGAADLPLHCSAAARQLEAQSAATLPPHTLMQRAGLAVAQLALAVAPHARRIEVIAGPGNNGGDGFEAGLHLHRWGKPVRLWWTGDAARQPADAAAARLRAVAAGVQIEHTNTLPADLSPWQREDTLLIDALLGRGLRSATTGVMAAWITAMQQARAPVLAVDLPSGLPADSGALEAGAACVSARWTLALLSLAPGLFTAQGRDHTGEVWWDDLGTSPLTMTPDAWLERGAALAQAAAPRRHAQHKGSFGDVWVVGGAAGMGGAALLAGRAALHSGAGRVYVCPLDLQALRLDVTQPELMWATALPAPEALAQATVVAGCGGGHAIADVLPTLLNHSGRLVLDADALNAIAADTALATVLIERSRQGRPTVLTPHPLEAARLLGRSTATIQADRLGAAQALADRYGAAVVLKGSGSVVAAPGVTPSINSSGNSALATPGSGDVLAGCLGALWARTGASDLIKAQQAARAACYLHGWVAQSRHPHGEALPAASLATALADGLEQWQGAPSR